jgi:hypothetical protein
MSKFLEKLAFKIKEDQEQLAEGQKHTLVVLKETKDYLVLGVIGKIKIHREFRGNIFQPFTNNKAKSLPIFFVVSHKAPEEIKKQLAKDYQPETEFPIILQVNSNNIDLSSKYHCWIGDLYRLLDEEMQRLGMQTEFI